MVLCAATGAGKTHIAAAMIRSAVERHGGPVAFLADRIPLIEQTSERLLTAGIDHGIQSGERTEGLSKPVQLCSIQALKSRGFPEDMRMVIVDECHDQHRLVNEWLCSSRIPAIGLSATPFTRGLGKTWQTVVNVATTDWLTEQGWLVPVRVFAGASPDMEGARTSRGEWTSAEVARRAIPLVGNIVEEWGRRTRTECGGPVKTMVFASTVAHAEDLAGQWARAGCRFETVTYRDKKGCRSEVIKEFKKPDSNIIGLITVDALSKGVDLPLTRCLVSARPFRRSVAAWVQQLGRGLRPHPEGGKDWCLLLDHAGNYLRHAEEVEQFWADGCRELDDGKRAKPKVRQPKEKTTERECVGCHLVMPVSVDICPSCGLPRPRRKVDVETVSGRLREVQRREAPPGVRAGLSHLGDLWPHLACLARARGRTRPWAAMQHHLLTGRWPRGSLEVGDECAPEVEAAVTRNQRAYWARRRGRARR